MTGQRNYLTPSTTDSLSSRLFLHPSFLLIEDHENEIDLFLNEFRTGYPFRQFILSYLEDRSEIDLLFSSLVDYMLMYGVASGVHSGVR